MNAKQRNKNRETAQVLRYVVGEWDSKNRRVVPAGMLEQRRAVQRQARRG